MSSDNFPKMPSDSKLPEIGMLDPNNTAQDMDDTDLPSMGKSKISKTDMGGDSAKNAGYGFMTNSETMKIQGGAPGNGSGKLTDNNGQGNSSGIPAAKPIDVKFYGDPNNTAIDQKDNYGPESNG